MHTRRHCAVITGTDRPPEIWVAIKKCFEHEEYKIGDFHLASIGLYIEISILMQPPCQAGRQHNIHFDRCPIKTFMSMYAGAS
jgi:hypothetical protein